MKKLTKKKFTSITPSQLGKMKAPELREMLRGARNLLNKQIATFSKYKNSVYSPALEKMQSYYDDAGKQNISNMRVSKMRNELFRLQDFFNSDTSTVPGARKVAIEQDKRIFGETEKGKAKKRMTLEQRTNFWAAYNEFINLNSEAYVRNMGSNTIQQYLGQMVLETRKNFDLDATNFEQLKQLLEDRQDEEEWERSNYEYFDSDVSSGKRPY